MARAQFTLLVPATRGVLTLIGLAPWLTPLLLPLPVVGALFVPFEAWFELQCHRDPSRSLSVLGLVLPVCLRCLGIYVGLGLGGLVAWPRLAPAVRMGWVGVAAALMIFDVWSESAGYRPPAPWLRLLTGVFLAYPVGVAIVDTVRVALYGEPAPSAPSGSSR